MKYIKRDIEGILISEKEGITKLNTTLKKYINELCIKGLSTYEGRINAVKKQFNFKSLVPVYINNELILFPTASLREFDSIFINYEEILSITNYQGSTIITFKDLTNIVVKESYYKIYNQIKKIKIIKKYLISYNSF